MVCNGYLVRFRMLRACRAHALSPSDWTRMFLPIAYMPIEIPATTPQYQIQYHDSNHPRAWGNTPKWIRELARCIRQHESKHDYRAHNKSSSAAGAYQFIDSTWQGNAKWTEWNGRRVASTYKAANHAPPWVQDLVFVHSIRHGGIANWNGTGCPGTR